MLVPGTRPHVVVVTPNPALDVTYTVDARDGTGGTVRVGSVLRRPGGKGLNVARVLHTLGLPVTAVHPLGGDAGAWIRRGLADLGLPTDSVDLPAPTRSTVTVVPTAPDGSPTGHPTVYAEPGPAVDAGTWDAVCARVAARCRPGDVLVVAGSLPPGAAEVAPLVRAGRTAGAHVVVDTGGPALLDAARAGADTLAPNAQEARGATGADDLAAAVTTLLDLGAGRVVVSDGAAGLVAARRPPAGTVRHPAVPGVTGNPTGAGDAATAGLAAAVLAGVDDTTALRWAAVLGAAAVLRPGAGEVDPADLPALDARLDPAPGQNPRTEPPWSTTVPTP